MFIVEEILLDFNIEIWGVGTPRTLRPIWMAEELGIPYKIYPIGPRTGETQTLEFHSLNPKQKVPVIKHGQFVLSESVAICRYLRRISPSVNIFRPKNNKDRAIEDEWCSFVYGELDETSLYVMRRHQDLKSIYGSAQNVVKSCRQYFEKNLNVVEKILAKNNTLLGFDFGLVDILLVSCLDWSTIYDIQLPQNVTRYYEHIKAREPYKRAFKINYKNVII